MRMGRRRNGNASAVAQTSAPDEILVDIPAIVFGFVTRPASSDPGVEIAPNQTRELTFSARAPGTYFYWARATSPLKDRFAGNQPFNALGQGVNYRVNSVTWREIAQDGVAVPARLAKPENAFVHIVSGETYDFELREDQPGQIPVEAVNWIYKT